MHQPFGAVGMPISATKSGDNGRPFTLASGSGTQLLECRAFQTVEVAFARRCLLKNMLRHFQRRYRLPTKKRRSVTTSFNACRMKTTVDASYLCFKSVIVAAPIVAAS
jgi:hypothetical protein